MLNYNQQEVPLEEIGLFNGTQVGVAKLVDYLEINNNTLVLFMDDTGGKVGNLNTYSELKKGEVYTFTTNTNVTTYNGYPRTYLSFSNLRPTPLQPTMYEFKTENLKSKKSKKDLVVPELLLKVVETKILPNLKKGFRKNLTLKDQDERTFYVSIFDDHPCYDEIKEETNNFVLFQNYTVNYQEDKNYLRLNSNPFSKFSSVPN